MYTDPFSTEAIGSSTGLPLPQRSRAQVRLTQTTTMHMGHGAFEILLLH